MFLEVGRTCLQHLGTAHSSKTFCAGIVLKLLCPSTVVSIEDPFDQDDWGAWKKFTGSVNIQVVGDDLTVTNPKRIAKAVDEKACNCLLLKVNQIGSVTESLQA